MASVILINQITNGSEYIYESNGSGYIGTFHVYDDGTIRTGPGLLNSTTISGDLLLPNNNFIGIPKYTKPASAPDFFTGQADSINIPLTPDGQSLIFEEDKMLLDGYQRYTQASHLKKYNNEIYTNVIDTTISELLNIRRKPPLEISKQPADIFGSSNIKIIQTTTLKLSVEVNANSIQNPPLKYEWMHDGIIINFIDGSNINGTGQNGNRGDLIIFRAAIEDSGFWNCQIRDSEDNIIVSDGIFIEVINQFDIEQFNGNIVKNGDGRQDMRYWDVISPDSPVALSLKDDTGPYYFGSEFTGHDRLGIAPHSFWDDTDPVTKGQPITKDQRYFYGGWQESSGKDTWSTEPLYNYTTMRQEIDISEAKEIIDREIIGIDDIKLDIWGWLGSMGWTEHIDGRYVRHNENHSLTWEHGSATLTGQPLITEIQWMINEIFGNGKYYNAIKGEFDNFLKYTEGKYWRIDNEGPYDSVLLDFRHTITSDWWRTQVHDKVYATFEFYGGNEEILVSNKETQFILQSDFYYKELPHSLYYYVVPWGTYSRQNNENTLMPFGGWIRACGTINEPGTHWDTGGNYYVFDSYGGEFHTNYYHYIEESVQADVEPSTISYVIGSRLGKWGKYLLPALLDEQSNITDQFGRTVYTDQWGIDYSAILLGSNDGAPHYGDGRAFGSRPFDFVYPFNEQIILDPIAGKRTTEGVLGAIAFNGLRFSDIYKRTKFYYREKKDITIPKGTRKVVITVRFERDKNRGWEYNRLGKRYNFKNQSPPEAPNYGLMNHGALTNLNATINIFSQPYQKV